MTFTLRPSTLYIREKLLESYQRNNKIAILTVKTGGGKTYGAIHTFGSIMPNATLLVFTTAKIVKSKQWERSVKDYNQVMRTNLKIICTNYDKLVSQKSINDIYQRLRLIHFQQVVLILDEVHRIKLAGNGKISKRSTMILKLAKQPFITTVLGLSATAFSNSYLDVAPYLVMAGYYKNKTEFLRKHIKKYDKYRQPVVTDDMGRITRDAFYFPEIIDAEIKSISVYVDTSQYKPLVHTYHEYFKLNRDERHLYNMIAEAYRNKEYEYPIQARMDQERMLAQAIPTQKDIYLIGLINMQTQGIFNHLVTPILIFYQYTSVCIHLRNLLHQNFPNRQIVMINGRAKVSNDVLKKPPADDAIYLVQYEAGGEGLDWQWSNISIFYESPVRYEKFVQAKGRNVRNKSQMPVVYQFELEFINTLDSERWETNRNKKDFTNDISKRTFLKHIKKVEKT